jgi:hypothetical protein
MIGFILFVIGIWVLGCVLEKSAKLLESSAIEKARRFDAENRYRAQTLDELRSMSKALNDPPPAPISARLAEVSRDVKRRHSIRDAMEKELGVK